MPRELFSPSWYRIANLRPRLRSHVRLHRHEYRGRTWFVLQDIVTDKFHRFSPAAYFVMGLMDGRRTVQEIWDTVMVRLGDHAPTQHDLLSLISQLHAADAILCDLPPDTNELARRAARHQRRTRLARFVNLFSWRTTLFDPDPLLSRLLPLARVLLSIPGALLWVAVVLAGVVVGAMHWPELSQDVVDRITAPQNVLLLWLLFPLIKFLHELGHGLVTKAFGGEVHDLGIMLLVFTPVPYVEASASWAFSNKWHRILVGAAGMMVELFLAAAAMLVWVSAEPGLVRAMAYNTILIAGVSTVAFNVNPLLRFDGYYMLMDFLEIPNLKTRANRYFGYLAERYLLGHREAEPQAATPGERAWFVGYGMASAVYRVVVVFAILVFLGEQAPLLAVLFAGLTALTLIVIPIVKGGRYLLASPELRLVRVRAVTTVACSMAMVVGVVFWLPVPFRTMTEGVVWLPDEAVVRAGMEGFVDAVVVPPGRHVEAGTVLAKLQNPEVAARYAKAKARLTELEARRTEQQPTDLVKAAILEEEIAYARRERDDLQARLDKLVLKSARSGTFVASSAQDLPGRFLRQGDMLGYVLELDRLTVRAIVPQSEIDLVRDRLHEAHVRLTERVTEPLLAYVSRIVPAGTDKLPSAALSTAGGGQVPADPKDEEGLTVLQPVFQVDLTVQNADKVVNAGGRVHVRFEHGRLPLSQQWGRQLRQLFLSRFHV